MSHQQKHGTAIQDQEALIRALVAMGYKREQIKTSSNAKPLETFDKKSVSAHVILPKRVTGALSDVGWERNKDGSYTIHIDNYHTTDRKWEAKVNTKYNIEVSKMALEKQGAKYVECVDAKGRTQLRALIETPQANPFSTKVAY